MPQWNHKWFHKTPVTFEEAYKRALLHIQPASASANEYLRFEKIARQNNPLPWTEHGKTLAEQIGQQSYTVNILNGAQAGQEDKFMKELIFDSSRNTVVTRDFAYFDKFHVQVEAHAMFGVSVAPVQWFNKQFISQYQNQLQGSFLGDQGQMPLLPCTVWVALKPRVVLNVTRTQYYNLRSDVEKNTFVGLQAGGLVFKDRGTILSDRMPAFFKRDKKTIDSIEFLSDSLVQSDRQQVIFEEANTRTNQGPGAIRFFAADIDGDRRDDIIQLWNCNGRLCILYYTAESRFTREVNIETGHGTGSMAFFMGDIDGDQRAEYVVEFQFFF